MSKAAFRQADVQRIFRAAKHEGFTVQIDIRSLTMLAIPPASEPIDKMPAGNGILSPGNLAPDGKENFDED